MAQQVPDWLARKIPGGLGSGSAAGDTAIAQVADERRFARGGFALSSPAFSDGGELDPCFTADEEDAVAPPLEWTAPPPGAQELAIVVEDISAGAAPRTHWLVWGLAPQKGKLLEGEMPPRVGKNGAGNSEWLLPSIPDGDGPHTYLFQLFALELPLTLMPGASRDDLVRQMDGNVMAASLATATYAGYEEEDWDEDEDMDGAD